MARDPSQKMLVPDANAWREAVETAKRLMKEQEGGAPEITRKGSSRRLVVDTNLGV